MRRPRLFASAMIALVAALLFTLTASATTWSNPFTVADPAQRPDVKSDSHSTLHFVWWNPNRRTIEYRHCTSASASACNPVEK